MSNRVEIITKNIFLDIAIRELYDRTGLHSKLCIIDFDSIDSLTELLNALRPLDPYYRVMLTGKAGVYSTLFNNFPWLHNRMTLNEINSLISTPDAAALFEIEERIFSYLNLQSLTDRQIRICALCCIYNIHTVASILKSTRKYIYQVVNVIMRRMELKSMYHLCFFFTQEFSKDLLYKMAGVETPIRKPQITIYRSREVESSLTSSFSAV